MEVFFARIVMPRSLARSLLSMILSAPDIASVARNVPDCFRRQSTSVVLPWSTCAMIAMLRSPDMGVLSGRGAGGRPLREALQGSRGREDFLRKAEEGARRGVGRYFFFSALMSHGTKSLPGDARSVESKSSPSALRANSIRTFVPVSAFRSSRDARRMPAGAISTSNVAQMPVEKKYEAT